MEHENSVRISSDEVYKRLSQRPSSEEVLQEHADLRILSIEDNRVIFLKLDAVAKILSPEATIRYVKGYYFFPRIQDHFMLPDGRVFEGAVQEECEVTIVNFLKNLRWELSENEESALRILAQQYKIHLMPKAECIPFVLEILTRHIADSTVFRSQLWGYKVVAIPPSCCEEVESPTIVIYPLLGKDNAQSVLDEIRTLFDRYDELGEENEETLPFNRKISNLVYYAQGDRTFKRKCLTAARLSDERKITKVFNIDLVHFSGKSQELAI